MINFKKLGDQIRELRKSKKITQKKLAYLSGMSEVSITKIEGGNKQNINLISLESIAEVLDISLSSLIASCDDGNDYNDFNLFDNSKIFLRNYALVDKTMDISSFAQLLLVLPVLGYRNILEICKRVGGEIIDRETYASRLIDNMLKNSTPTGAKQYVIRVLNIIKECKNKEVNSIDELAELFTANLDNVEFSELKDNYIEFIDNQIKMYDTTDLLINHLYGYNEKTKK